MLNLQKQTLMFQWWQYNQIVLVKVCLIIQLEILNTDTQQLRNYTRSLWKDQRHENISIHTDRSSSLHCMSMDKLEFISLIIKCYRAVLSSTSLKICPHLLYFPSFLMKTIKLQCCVCTCAHTQKMYRRINIKM